MSAGLPSLGTCALVSCPLGVLASSPGCRGRVLFLLWCLCGGPCCGWGRRLAVRAWWWAARGFSRRLLGGCSPYSGCGCALPPLCGFRWLVGVCRCVPYGVRSVLWRRVLAGLRLWGSHSVRWGRGRCLSLLCGAPFRCVRPGARRCVLSPCATVPGPSPSWPVGGFLLPCCVAPGALFMWASACYLGSLLARLLGCPFPSLALPLPVRFPFPVWWCLGGGGACGAPMAHAWGWVVWSHGGGFGGCRGG